MWENKDTYNGISVLPYDGGTYKQTPFEDITEEEYYKLSANLSDIDLSLATEDGDYTDLTGEAACAGGACEVDFDQLGKD
jgi:ribonucleoside-diphosphate reductase alpha chain